MAKWAGSLESKRVWLAIGSLLFVVFKDKVPLTEQQFQEILLMIATLIVGDSLRSVSPEKSSDVK